MRSLSLLLSSFYLEFVSNCSGLSENPPALGFTSHHASRPTLAKLCARVGILGLAFKENVRDLRNSRVPDIVRELEGFGLKVLVHDPLADPEHAKKEYDLELHPRADIKGLDALVLAVPHDCLMQDLPDLWTALRPGGYVADIKSVIDPASLPQGLRYWSL